jgi:hypothetical protein
MSKTIVAVIQEFHTHVAQRQEDERSTAPLWKLVARVRFVQLVQPELFEREKIGQPFVPRLAWTCPEKEYDTQRFHF